MRDLAEATDEELFIRCREAVDGEAVRRAVNALASRHHAALVRYLTGFLGAADAAEDVAQEAFIRIYKHAREYREVAKVSTWLFRIATNLALNEVRDRKRRPRLLLDRTASMFAGDDGDALHASIEQRREAGPDERAESGDRAGHVRRAIATLGEPYRAAILLCDMEGLTYEAAAEALDVPIGTIRSRLFRARTEVERALGPAVVRGDL